ncbi:hypothetical protein NDU88_007544 [Pleurodeles waltl]|uniref:Uncharacterized protein n=1 Tax=Pleurodeles waltl TaxID=8319 RepID=A0AAV7QL90_PLEWA|nr:hypothetical protein NDU88_007544 [Pleurodeles waltl]
MQPLCPHQDHVARAASVGVQEQRPAAPPLEGAGSPGPSSWGTFCVVLPHTRSQACEKPHCDKRQGEGNLGRADEESPED